MIGKVVSPRRDGKSSFGSIVRYIAGVGHDDKCTHIGTRNLNLVDGTEPSQEFVALTAAEMQSTATQNNRIQEPVFHAVVSWPKWEEPNGKQIEEAVNVIAKNLNLEDCQCVFAKHQNTDHTHLHIAFNRVHPDTYRAVQPAQRWTKKALEKAMREIEIKQDWGRELNGKHYTIIDDHVVSVKSVTQDQSLTQKAMDFEAHTGEESTQSKIRELISKDFIKKINSWDDFHAELDKLKIAYEKKGSGAIFRLEGQEVKASNIAKKYGFSHLEKCLGTYVENKIEGKNNGEVGSENKNEAWNKHKNKTDDKNYKNESAEKLKKRLIAELRDRQQNEVAALKETQKERRKEALQGSWKGKGAERNFLQSIMAVTFSKERGELIKKHVEERAVLNTSLKQKKQKKGRGNYVEAQNANIKAQYLNKNEGGIFGLEAIRVAGGAGYKKKGHAAPPLVVDTGCRIRTTVVNEEAILATLQLAAAKWGGCEIHGTKQYKAICIDLAVKHRIKITNPELQESIKEKQARKKSVQTKQIPKGRIQR